MIGLGPEPEGLLIRRAEVFAWLPGLSVKEWRQIRELLQTVELPGCERPYYRREEVRAKLVNPIFEAELRRGSPAAGATSTQQPKEYSNAR